MVARAHSGCTCCACCSCGASRDISFAHRSQTRPNQPLLWRLTRTVALGVVPVGFPAATFGDDDDDGLWPWVEQRLDELDAGSPNLFDEGDGIDDGRYPGSVVALALLPVQGLPHQQ